METVSCAAGSLIFVSRKADIPKSPENGVIYVLDDRRNPVMPNVRVAFSYRQRTRAEMDAVLDVLLLREQADPTAWKRTRDSMRREWELHNLCYRLHVLRGSARHVDLDNKDERSSLFLQLVLRLFRKLRGGRG